jgi:hypothetical protein
MYGMWQPSTVWAAAGRALFALAACASLTLSVLAVALWVRSYWTVDVIVLTRTVVNREAGIALVFQVASRGQRLHLELEAVQTLSVKGGRPITLIVSPGSAPALVVAVLGALLPAGWLMERRRRTRSVAWRLEHGLCAQCGYDLRASSKRCPECGESIVITLLESCSGRNQGADTIAIRPRLRQAMMLVLLLNCLLVVMVGAVYVAMHIAKPSATAMTGQSALETLGILLPLCWVAGFGIYIGEKGHCWALGPQGIDLYRRGCPAYRVAWAGIGDVKHEGMRVCLMDLHGRQIDALMPLDKRDLAAVRTMWEKCKDGGRSSSDRYDGQVVVTKHLI